MAGHRIDIRLILIMLKNVALPECTTVAKHLQDGDLLNAGTQPTTGNQLACFVIIAKSYLLHNVYYTHYMHHGIIN